jgi:hypothetical protein
MDLIEIEIGTFVYQVWWGGLGCAAVMAVVLLRFW